MREIKESIVRVNCLFNMHPQYNEDENFTVLRFPIKFMTEEELAGVASIADEGDFYAGYIDFNDDFHPPNLLVLDSLQDCLEELFGNVPFVDISLN